MECEICLNNWDSKVFIPRLLPCGHTFCENCLIDLVTKSSNRFLCPMCRFEIINVKSKEDIFALPKNFTLLKISSKIEERKTIVRQKQSDTVFNLNTSIMKETKLKRKFTVVEDNLCKKHGKVMHSYAIGTSMLFCDDCKKEKGLKTVAIPSVSL